MLTRLAPWLVTAIAIVFAGLIWRLADLRAEVLTLERDQALKATAVTQTALAWQKSQTEAISQALTKRDKRLASIAQSMAEKRQSLDTLERNDAKTRSWSDEPVPDAVRSWVQQLGAEDGTDGSEADSAAASASTAASADGSG